jgi:hypothetical protein
MRIRNATHKTMLVNLPHRIRTLGDRLERSYIYSCQTNAGYRGV